MVCSCYLYPFGTELIVQIKSRASHAGHCTGQRRANLQYYTFFFSIGNQSFENSILCDRNREPIGIKADDDAHTSYRGESCIHCVRGKVQNRKLCIFNAFRSRIYRECNEILCYKHMRSQTALVVVNARAVRITLGCIERMQGLYIVFD